MKIKLLSLFVVLFSLQSNAQTLNPTVSIAAAGTADTFKGGYTFAYPSSGTPWGGPLISFGGFSNQYDCQLNSNYGGNNISFRTRNGDIGIWNTWNELATRGVNTFNGNQSIIGNLGIGTAAPLSGGGGAKWLTIDGTTSYGGGLISSIGGVAKAYYYWEAGFAKVQGATGEGIKLDVNNSTTAMTILANSNVGIGTTTPAAKLDIVGDIYIDNLDWSTDNALRIREGSSNSYGAFFKYGLNDLLTIGTRHNDSDYIAFQVPRGSSNVTFNGNVGIGTPTPDEKLTVKGKIHAQEVKVDLQGACAPDYVFQKYYTGKSNLKSDYVMPTLAEIESFTKKNHHLPNVPSAQEVQQNGVSLGEMSNVLLQKVEELTLYAIEQQKKLEEQNKTIATLAARLASLEKK